MFVAGDLGGGRSLWLPERLGFEALSALPPHAYPFSDEEIYEYYSELASVTALPFIVYKSLLGRTEQFRSS